MELSTSGGRNRERNNKKYNKFLLLLPYLFADAVSNLPGEIIAPAPFVNQAQKDYVERLREKIHAVKIWCGQVDLAVRVSRDALLVTMRQNRMSRRKAIRRCEPYR